MQLTSKVTIESKAIPGVKFTVRRLDSSQRAARDLTTMAARRKTRELSQAWRALLPELLADGKTYKNPADDTPELKAQREPFDEEFALVTDSVLKPASVRAALVSITDLSIDDKLITSAKDFLDARGPATDGLFNEIYQACEEASGLTDEERKNLLPPIISKEVVAGETTDSTVIPAGD